MSKVISGKVLRAISFVPIVLVLLFLASQANAQQTTRGKDFYLTFLPNFHNSVGVDTLYIYVVAEVPTNVKITRRDASGNQVVTNYFISDPSKIYQTAYAWKPYELQGYNYNQTGQMQFIKPNENEVASKKYFHIEADQDVGVYALNQAVTTSDASLVLPTGALGTNYVVMSYKSDGVLDNSGRLATNYTPSQFAVVATEDNTEVTIVPSCNTTESGKTTKKVILNKGESCLIQAEYSTKNLDLDLTGTIVDATAPVAVFSGHQRATIPWEQRSNLISRDCLYEQLLPTTVWGKSYIITPLPPVKGSPKYADDLWRVLARQDSTIIKFNNRVIANLNRGQFYEAALTTAGVLTSNKSVSVAYFKATNSRRGGQNSLESSDPFMMMIPPKKQYLTNYLFQNTQVIQLGQGGWSEAYDQQYVTVVTTDVNVPTIKIDGAPVNATFQSVPNTCYVYAHVEMKEGAHSLTSQRPVGLYVFGYGPAVSYGYVGGMSFRKDEEIFVNAGGDQYICIGDSMTLSAQGNVDKVQWEPKQFVVCDTCKTTRAFVDKNTTFFLSAVDSLGCSAYDTMKVYVLQPATVRAEPDTLICAADPVLLKAIGNYKTVRWEPPLGLACSVCPTTLAYSQYPKPGAVYKVYARTADSETCEAVDSVEVRYALGINGQLPQIATLCKGDSLKLSIKNFKGSLKWTPSKGLSCDTCAEVMVKVDTNTRIIVTAVDATGCVSKDTTDIRIAPKASLELNADSVSICQGESTSLQATTNATEIQWLPRESLSCDVCTNPVASPQVTTTYKVTAKVGTSCSIVDSITVVVLPKPYVTTTVKDTSICKGEKSPINTIRAGDGVLQWSPKGSLDCDTCASVIASPDTTTVYTVTLTHPQGCTSVAQVTVRVKELPDVQASPDTSLCIGAGYAMNAVGGSTFTWSPSEGISCSVCSNPVAVPQKTTTYIVTAKTAEGCEKKDSVTITVNELPTLTVSPDTSICLNKSAQLRANSTGRILWSNKAGWESTTPTATVSPTAKTTYYIVATSPQGCAVNDSVIVDIVPCNISITVPTTELALGGIVACDTVNRTFTIENNGEEIININAIETVANEWGVITATAPQQPIAVGDKVVVPFSLYFTKNGNFQIPLKITFNNDSSKIYTFTGNAQLFTVQQQSIASTNLSSDGKLAVPVQFNFANWNEVHIREFRSTIEFNPTWFVFDTTKTYRLPSDWTLSKPVVESGKVSVLASGTSILNTSDSLFAFMLNPLLSAESNYTPTLRITYPKNSLCATTPPQTLSINYQACVARFRNIVGSEFQFQLRSVIPNPAISQNINVNFEVGYDCHTSIELIDAFGNTVQNILNNQLKAGEYELQVPTQELASGTYFMRLRAGHYTETKILVLTK